MKTNLVSNNEHKQSKKIPLSTYIYEKLKLKIINGDFPSHYKLTEASVSEQMNVSATPVREAFKRLSVEGLVKIIPWKGVFVQTYSEKEIKETYQCRIALEVLAIQLAINFIDEDGIRTLERLLEASNQVETATELFEINTKIHNTILGYADNRKLKKLLSDITDLIQHDRSITSFSIDRTEKIQQEHTEIVNAIKCKNVKEAEKAMRTHIENGYNYIIQQKLKRDTENFSL